MTKTKLFRFLVYTLLILAILYFLSLIDFILQPIGTVITSIALPIIGAGFLFYVTEPLIRLFERFNIKRIFAVILVFIIIILVMAFSVYFLIPMVQDQLTRLSDNAPAFRS
jgi:predicted PurR-regulated permease PerM